VSSNGARRCLGGMRSGAYIENGGNANDAYRKTYSAAKMKSEAVCKLKNANVALTIQHMRAAHLSRPDHRRRPGER